MFLILYLNMEILALSQPVLDSDISPACLKVELKGRERLQVNEWDGTRSFTSLEWNTLSGEQHNVFNVQNL